MQTELLHQSVPFVGRTRELRELGASLASPECRLMTITGPGGSGKTRLAIEIMRQAGGFKDGKAFVGLQSLADSSLIVPTIARAVDMSFYGNEDPTTQLLFFLRAKSVLLVLDNFEHLLDGSTLVSAILAHAPGVKILVTSREPLNLQEEWLYPLKGMDTPVSVYSSPLETYEAVQLFLYHARRLQPNFELRDAHESVVTICSVAGGMPLAIELAASWLKGLSAAQIAREMQRNLDFLRTTTRDVAERHRSIRAVFDQSWNLLSEEERLIFARLTVFRGGFDSDAADHVAGASLPLMVALVEKSLVRKLPGDRWDVHALLRQYGEEKRAELGLGEPMKAAHTHYFAGLMHTYAQALKGPDQIAVLDAIERDFENIRMAWNWALEHGDEASVDQMAESLYLYGFVRSRFRETLELFQHALSRTFADRRVYGRLLTRRWGYFHWMSQQDTQAALNDLQAALAIAEDAEDRFEVAFAQLMTGYVRINRGEHQAALTSLDESLALFHALGDPYYEAWVMHRIGYAWDNLGQPAQLIEWTERSLQVARSAPNLVALVNCLYNLGSEYMLMGDLAKGAAYCEEAQRAAIKLGHQWQIAHATDLLALAAFWHADFEASHQYAQRGMIPTPESTLLACQDYPLYVLVLLACLRENYGEAQRLETMARAYSTNRMGLQLQYWSSAALACGMEDRAKARAYFSDALRMAVDEGSVTVEVSLVPIAAYLLAETRPVEAARLLAWAHHSADPAVRWFLQWPIANRLHEDLQRQLGSTGFDAEWDRGETMSREAVLALLQTEFAAGAAAPIQNLIDPLTERELEVLQLLATGLTNPQIAEQLVIGAGTVKTHTLNIYRKLDVANRSQAILRGQELGLVTTSA